MTLIYVAVEVSGRRLPTVDELGVAMIDRINPVVKGWTIIDVHESTDPNASYRKGRQEGERTAAATDLEAARRAIARHGPPPPGEGTHPLQTHRDSMG